MAAARSVTKQAAVQKQAGGFSAIFACCVGSSRTTSKPAPPQKPTAAQPTRSLSSTSRPKPIPHPSTPAMAPTDTTAHLAALRALLTERNLHAYIVPSEDAHQSEYIADCDGRRAFISGFTGSAGLAVVTLDQAALWTDGRYFLQASQQLDSNWILQKFGLPETPTKEAWLADVLPPSSRVGVDPTLLAIRAAEALQSALENAGHELVAVADNLVDAVWGDDRPATPNNPVTVLSVEFAGRTVEDKLAAVRAELAKPLRTMGAPTATAAPAPSAPKSLGDATGHGLLLSALDDIAWLFNLRGSDIAYNPVFFAYALVTADEAILWVDDSKLNDEVHEHLAAANVTVRPYTAIVADLTETHVPAFETQANVSKFVIDGRCSLALVEALGKDRVHIVSRNPVTSFKAVKNAVEVEGFRQSHIRDAAALVSYFAWLEDELVVKERTDIDEVDGSDALEEFRSKQHNFVGLSFDTISGSGPNGAIIHYKPEKGACRIIDADHVYLCDSGAQFKDGTTDVTRTLHLKGTATDFEKACYTRVLQGHIALARAVFPKGTSGFSLDILARAPLWQVGLDYRHGTGHGVGHFLNVHEGPHSISPRTGSLDVALVPGMTVSNEPGFYHEESDEHRGFGIRIENVIVVKEANTPHQFGGAYYAFENLTMVPMDKNLIDLSLLSVDEKQWLDAYHAECWEKVSPLLEEESIAWNYLKKATTPLEA
ncbi:hypothetical protein AMAG_04170 [Allomyces macrogynus ATCC 38327]|uniref:Xaa-Pro aminopeptidase P n=1 Tax=Allomyces macrogynus (strain ATCC 38327) TaxID=578462 RepID=A0A0L0S7Y2_ALLM3|nr:hypothetical protein AMAG_04170 [Allomyces macrogynus ATCC 38327]|eukprot:KNE58607.1 hypothetical protein AMAG_04170 [Allomyces macrogynus ATCC 38327]